LFGCTHARKPWYHWPEAAELAGKIKRGKLKDGFSVRDIYKNHWHLLNTQELAQAACEELIEANWLRSLPEEIPGRQPKKIYQVNPKIFS